MTAQESPGGHWTKLPVSLRAIIAGILVGLIGANVWPLVLVILGVPLAATAELVFLALYIWWGGGGGPPRRTQAVRQVAFRSGVLTPAQWCWGLIAALSFAVAIHAAVVLLFRFVPFPTQAFRHGYDLSFIPSISLKWVVIVISATSAAICEETGFRGYMQQPIEQRHGAMIAIFVSSFFFMLLHLTKAWALVGMIPIVFGAGVLLGLLAWSSQSLIPSMIGHFVMDVGLFAYWWTGIAGNFTARPIAQTGIDWPFLITCTVFMITPVIVLLAIWKLARMKVSNTVAV
jgi:membrane protease YdiL (CAAX protease family)